MRRFVVLAILAAVAGVALFVALSRPPAQPLPSDVFAATLPPGITYVPMSEAERTNFETSFRDAVDATAVTMRTVEIRNGSAPVGIRVVSLVLPRRVNDDGRARLFEKVQRIVPFREPRRDEWEGRTVWAHHADETLSSVAVVLDDRRLVVVYGGLQRDERLVISLLDI